VSPPTPTEVAPGHLRATPSRSPRVRPAVAVVVSRFPRLTETFILREIDELERQGQPVRLVSLLHERPPVVHPEARPWERRALYTPFLSLPVLASNLRTLGRRPGRYAALLGRLILGTLASPGVLLRTLAFFPKAVHLGERLEAEGLRHLHAHFATYPATVAWVASELFELTFSFTAHAHDLFVDRALLRSKVAAARFVRVISRFNRRYLEDRYPEAREPGRVEVIHMGIEPERYGADAPRPRAPGGPARLLCIAALKPYKGIPVLLEACEALAREGRSFVCDVVGEGPERRALERQIRRRGLGGAKKEGEGEAGAGDRVRLVGAVSQQEVARRLARADVVVLPSVVAPDGQMEGLPVVLMEALASRRPVVATALSGIPELVEDGETGLLVPPGDAGALAAAITRLLEEPKLARSLAAAGRRRVEERFDVRGTVAALAARLDGESGPAPSPSPVLERWIGAVRGEPVLGLRRRRESPDARVTEWLLPAGAGGSAPDESAADVRREDVRREDVRREDVPRLLLAREVVLKQPRDRPGQSRPPRERARREHEALRRLYDAGVAVPRPLGLPMAEQETPAVVMEAVAGEPLDRLLRRRRFARGERWAELEAAFGATGTWLREFQQATATGGGEGRRVARHGDLWPGNVRVDLAGWGHEAGRTGSAPPTVTVLDWEGFEAEASPSDDAAHFLVHAGLYLAYPLLGGRRRRLERAFCRGWRPRGLAEAERRELERARAAEARGLLAAPDSRGVGRGPGAFWRRLALHRWVRAGEQNEGSGRER